MTFRTVAMVVVTTRNSAGLPDARRERVDNETF